MKACENAETREILSKKNDSLDTCAIRLEQAAGVLAAIEMTWDDEEKRFHLGPTFHIKALYALSEILHQASEAFDQFIDADNELTFGVPQ